MCRINLRPGRLLFGIVMNWCSSIFKNRNKQNINNFGATVSELGKTSPYYHLGIERKRYDYPGPNRIAEYNVKGEVIGFIETDKALKTRVKIVEGLMRGN